MGIELIGLNGATAEVDPTHDALHTTSRPPEAAGAFRVAEFSGLMTAIAAAGNVFLFRNANPTNLVLLQFLHVKYQVVTGFTAAQELAFVARQVRNWATPTVGGTQISVANNNMKKRTALAASMVDARISTTTVLTAPGGVTVSDTNPFLVGMGKTLAAGAAVQDASFEAIYDGSNGSDYPFVIAPNEGFAIQNSILMGAAGTVRMSVTAAWLEAETYG
jgi:hypothetical protein